ncbi:MAG: beta-propeller fold lactonase family protein [Gemmatimonadaceae bacterium]
MQHKKLIAAVSLLATACGGGMMEPTRPSATTASTSRSESAAHGAVYTMSNDASANAVLAFTRHADGTLGPAVAFSTGGAGTGAGLGSQGSLVLDADARLLFAVNAGSNEISSFRVNGAGLTQADKVPSGGTQPISITIMGRLLYVLNAGGAGNITGFSVSSDGKLTPVRESTRSLSGSAVAPAQVGFSPDGQWLVVTEKAANSILTFRVAQNGRPSGRIVSASAGQTPFGFSFTSYGLLVVSEAFGGAPNASAASSYRIRADGSLGVVSASVATHQTAACWVAIPGSNRFAFTTNTGSASLSGFSIREGRLSLLQPSGIAASSGAAPIDAAFGRDGEFLYELSAGSHSIGAYQLQNASGDLTNVGSTNGLPASAVGLAAR